MAFDPCEQRIRNIIIRAGKIIRQLKGLPEETNISLIYRETAEMLGIAPTMLSSSDVNKLPNPEESARENPGSKLVQICPSCGKKAYFLRGLCKTCKEAEGGKYRTMFECFECHHAEKSKEPVVVWLDRLGIDYKGQSKKSLGIDIVTDEGIK